MAIEQASTGQASVEQASSEIEVVRAFLSALERLDIDAAAELLAPDVIYQNVPFPPARGKDAVLEQLRWLGRNASAFGVEYHNVAGEGPVVLTERTDTLTFGKVSAAFWVCGTFEVHDGRITLWRDRFDLLTCIGAFVQGALKALLDAATRATSTPDTPADPSEIA